MNVLKTSFASFLLLLTTSYGWAAARRPLLDVDCNKADTVTRQLWEKLDKMRSDPRGCKTQSGGEGHCEQIEWQLQRLSISCPSNASGLAVNADVEYFHHRLPEAQRYLDQLAELGNEPISATVLRARISLEEGNIPFAVRFLERNLQLSPQETELREVYASALYMSGKALESIQQLNFAEQLGAPRWRIAYNRGVIYELDHDEISAIHEYQKSLEAKSVDNPAAARLRALRVTAPYRTAMP